MHIVPIEQVYQYSFKNVELFLSYEVRLKFYNVKGIIITQHFSLKKQAKNHSYSIPYFDKETQTGSPLIYHKSRVM